MNQLRADFTEPYWQLSSGSVLPVVMVWLICTPGCRHDEEPMPLVSVSGMVLFEGKPADGATVTLHHTDPAIARRIKPAGIVEVDGTFKIGTYEDEDGAPQGNYKATFEWTNPEGGQSLLPFPFSSPELSNFNVKVTESPTVLPTFEFHKPPETPSEKPNFMP